MGEVPPMLPPSSPPYVLITSGVRMMIQRKIFGKNFWDLFYESVK